MLLPSRYASDVALELVDGLREGSISLDPQSANPYLDPYLQLRNSRVEPDPHSTTFAIALMGVLVDMMALAACLVSLLVVGFFLVWLQVPSWAIALVSFLGCVLIVVIETIRRQRRVLTFQSSRR